MEKKYHSKTGWIILFYVLLMTFYCTSSLISLRFLDSLSWFFIIPFIIFLLLPFLYARSCYIIHNDTLIIKNGFFKKFKIEIKSIRKIKETKSLFRATAYAFSLDRIEITYKKYDRIMLSPKNKQDFIQDLLTINPYIEVQYKTKK